MHYNRYILLLFFFLANVSFTETNVSVASLTTSFAYTVEELVIDHFIKGGCQNVSDISLIGNELGVGYFSNAEEIIGFSSGIILATGNIKNAMGPNDDIGVTTSFSLRDGDPDLDLFATDLVLDAEGIEFDFVPFGDQVEFRYVFASEEYCEYVGSKFNDSFGFFVSGPGIEGEFFNDAINVATLPNTGEYVTINNVNHNLNAGNYIKNELVEDVNNCGISFGANNLEEIQYDGFTTPLKATIDVIPCETYHIRLVVGDVGDDILDSAVFLEAKSFDLGEGVSVVARSEGNRNAIAYEKCRDGEFVFSRSRSQNIDEPLEINFNISPDSDATADVDYKALPTSITIPANELQVVLPVEVLVDNEIEMPELLALEIDYGCSCLGSNSAELIIAELDTIDASFEEVFVCLDQEFSIGPIIQGGAEPFVFQWSTGATTTLLSEIVNEATDYTVTISDACGNTTTATAEVGIQEIPIATLSGDALICGGDTTLLKVDLEGNSPWSIRFTIDGMEQPAIDSITTSPFLFPVSQIGNYVLTSFEDAQCYGIPQGEVQVISKSASLEITSSIPSCPFVSDGSISISISDGVPPYEVLWDDGATEVLQREGLLQGTYSVSVTDSEGCQVSNTIELGANETFDRDCLSQFFYIPNAFSPNADGNNDEFTIHFRENRLNQRIKSAMVYDRWGELMINLSNISPESSVSIWNGFYKGKKMNAGVYVWVMEVEFSNGETTSFSGDVSLIE